MIILAAAHFAWAGAQVKPVDGRISKMQLTAIELAHYMAPGVNLGNTMEDATGMMSLPIRQD